MKVSKVEHRRTAIGKNLKKEAVNGIIYKSPIQEKDLPLRSYLATQNEKNQKIYSLFGGSFFYLERELKNDKNNEKFKFQKELAEKICKNFTFLEKRLLKNEKLGELQPGIGQLNNCKDEEWEEIAEEIVKVRIEEQIEILRNYNACKSFVHFQNREKTQCVDCVDFVHRLVTFQLRKSLRRTVKDGEKEGEIKVYLPDVLEKLVLALCAGRNYKENFGKINEREIRAFLKAVNYDYLRLKQIKGIADSIEKKNVKVQVGEQKLLQLSNAGHPKKGVVFEFMKEYANADRKRQDEMLCHMQMLIVLFLEGKRADNRIEKAIGKGIWLKNRYQWSEDDVFGFMEKGKEGEEDREKEKSNEKDDKNNILVLIKRRTSDGISAVEKKRLGKQIQEDVQRMISEHFREARDEWQKKNPEVPKDDKKKKADMFWLEYIEKVTEKALVENEKKQVRKKLKSFKLQLSWLYQFIWRDWVSYMAVKFVDMGKAVYHFAMPDLMNRTGKLSIKEAILPENVNEITSFDYELINADETLERDLSLYISFAINRFSRAVAPESSYETIGYRKGKNGKKEEIDYTDILFINSKFSTEEGTENAFVVYEDYKRRLLQYFGGKSQYNGIEESRKYEMINVMKVLIEYVRNYTFHYTGTIDLDETYTNELLEKIYHQEQSQVGSFYRKKYYSNNVPAFYEVKKIDALMEYLYKSPKNTPAQIPAFNRVLPRKDLDLFLSYIGIEKRGLQYQGCIYFLLKEIYYYDFIKQKNLREMFTKALRKRKTERGKETWAKNNFKDRVEKIDCSLSMGELAQIIMTDYNMQNQIKEVRTNTDNHADESYKHFPILLAGVLQDAFKDFLTDKCKFGVYSFLRKPFAEPEKIDEKEFCNLEWKCNAFKDVLENKSKLHYAWYVTAHFMNPRYLNLLIGSIKNYVAYIHSIERRAKDAGNEIAKEKRQTFDKKISVMEETLSILEFVMVLSGRVSPCFGDYFDEASGEAKEQYVKYLSDFVSYAKIDGSVKELREFCCEKIAGSPSGKVGLYYDGENPILNRNIILSHLYGDEKLMAATISKIERSEIENYYKLMNKLSKVFDCVGNHTETEQRELVKFQHIKNRIELYDVMKLSEIINDLVSQIISWAYLRERDLMYFQLGYHYIKLFYGDVKENWMQQIKTDEFEITDGALLYQIVAMYTFSLPIYLREKDGIWRDGNGNNQGTGTGSALGQFKKYCGGSYDVYVDGLHLFEEVDRQHDEMILLRNHSDHFKYYAFHDMSILEIYAKIYNGFFSYDRKLQKSLSFIFPNILQRYSVKTRMEIAKGRNITVELKSDEYTYKVKEGEKEKKIKINVREESFIKQLKSILEYKVTLKE